MLIKLGQIFLQYLQKSCQDNFLLQVISHRSFQVNKRTNIQNLIAKFNEHEVINNNIQYQLA